jgi:predicted dehydrogenase
VDEGFIGEILSTTMMGSGASGSVIDARNVYMADKANGANMLTITVGHALDILCFCLGE